MTYALLGTVLTRKLCVQLLGRRMLRGSDCVRVCASAVGSRPGNWPMCLYVRYLLRIFSKDNETVEPKLVHFISRAHFDIGITTWLYREKMRSQIKLLKCIVILIIWQAQSCLLYIYIYMYTIIYLYIYNYIYTYNVKKSIVFFRIYKSVNILSK